MKNRKKILLASLVIGVWACSNVKNEQQTNRIDTISQDAEAEQMDVQAEQIDIEMSAESGYPIFLSESQFRQNVANIKDNKLKFNGLKPCIVDFYADWCRPCKMMASMYAELAQEYAEKIDFYKVNIDECEKLTTELQIHNIPTFLVFDKKGKYLFITGMQDKETMKRILNNSLLSNE